MRISLAGKPGPLGCFLPLMRGTAGEGLPMIRRKAIAWLPFRLAGSQKTILEAIDELDFVVI